MISLAPRWHLTPDTWNLSYETPQALSPLLTVYRPPITEHWPLFPERWLLNTEYWFWQVPLKCYWLCAHVQYFSVWTKREPSISLMTMHPHIKGWHIIRDGINVYYAYMLFLLFSVLIVPAFASPSLSGCSRIMCDGNGINSVSD